MPRIHLQNEIRANNVKITRSILNEAKLERLEIRVNFKGQSDFLRVFKSCSSERQI